MPHRHPSNVVFDSTKYPERSHTREGTPISPVRQQDLELRFLAYMGERGLLRRTRPGHICASLRCFTLVILLPNRHFQSLGRTSTLSINYYPAVARGLAKPLQILFDHFHPNLTSPTLQPSQTPSTCSALCLTVSKSSKPVSRVAERTGPSRLGCSRIYHSIPTPVGTFDWPGPGLLFTGQWTSPTSPRTG